MKRQIPDTPSEAAIEAFFDHLGLTVTVVNRCPDAACEWCGKVIDEAA